LKHLELTDKGQSAFAEISRTASDRVASALQALDPCGAEQVVRGLEHYADALSRTAQAPIEDNASDCFCLHQGYMPGVIGRTVGMHAAYYSRTVGFGLAFEAKVAREMAEFTGRLENHGNAIWAATRSGQIVGTVAIDGEDLDEGIAHLRWFIVGDGQRGAGIGKMLIDAAMDFVDRTGFKETHLWTFRGLEAARRLYERAGFELVDEKPGAQWGETVHEQRFVRRRELWSS
jgi:GNAT superfamily N-acetyltransferase